MRKFSNADCFKECVGESEITQCYSRCLATPKAATCIASFFPPTFVPIEPLLLLAAGKFVILTKTGVTTTGVTSVTGDIGSSLIAISSNTGFGLTLDSGSGGAFSTSNLVDGEMYGADHAAPTPSMLTRAVGAMGLAYTTVAGRVGPNFTELGGGNIDGKSLEPGLYKWGTGVRITSSLVFNGPEGWCHCRQYLLAFGTGTENMGVFLCKTSIVFNAGSILSGAALAQTAVTLDAATIVKNSVCNTCASYPC